MSLITRCPACGTMFKVVPDQLKVSQGWVRCGHCAEVFDASLQLQDEPVPLPPAPGASGAAANPAPALPVAAADVEKLPSAAPASVTPDADPHWTPGVFFAAEDAGTARSIPVFPDARVAHENRANQPFDPAVWRRRPSETSPSEPNGLRPGAADEARVSEPPARAAEPASRPVVAHLEHETSDWPDDNEDIPAALEDVSFVRDARRRAFWRRPVVRVGLGLVACLLAFVLLLQVLVQQKDALAALEPGLRPMLQTLCVRWHCEVGPLRRIEAVVIDSSSFSKIDGNVYRLGFSIKNTGAVPLAMPSLELTLTDNQDQALIRRVLAPAQLGAPGVLPGAGADFSASLMLQVADADAAAPAASPGAAATAGGPSRIAGYRVLAFYP